jgi:cytoskeletal protein RodZ
MSKKRIVALVLSLVVIFGLGFAGYKTLHQSAATNADNTYTTTQKKADKSSSSSASSSAASSSEQKAAAQSESTGTKSTSGNATADSASNESISKLGSGKSGTTTGTKSNGSTQTTGSKSATTNTTAKTHRSASAATATASHRAVCSIVVRGPIKEGNKVLMSQSNVTIHSGDKVSTVLTRVAKAKHIAVAYQGTGNSVYIRGIAGLFEFDKGSGSGWLYEVNNKFPGYSAGKYKVKNGDKIQWVYTANLGKDRHAPVSGQR